ncbi:MAG: hypothetical protein U0270_31730 [Labilithrix sp.]
MRATILRICILLVACSPFAGEAGDGDAPPSGAGASTKDGGASRDDGASPLLPDGGTSLPDGGSLEVPLACARATLTRSMTFDAGSGGWDPLGAVDPIDDPDRRSMVGHFRWASDVMISDRSTVRVQAPVAADPEWARVEWDATTLEADPYACFGCTLGLMERLSDNLTERGRAYLATQFAPFNEKNGIYATLDAFWQPFPEKLHRSTALGRYDAAWHHYTFEMIFHHEVEAPTLTLRVLVDGVLDRELPHQRWVPKVDGITSSCGVLYQEPVMNGATVELKMDNITLTVCPL